MKQFGLILIMLFSLQVIMPATVYGESAADRERQKLIQQLERLRKQKAAESSKVEAAGVGEVDIATVISSQEKYLRDNCTGGVRSNRCADMMYSVSANYYKAARDGFVQAQLKFDNAISKWEKNPIGTEPIPPRPSYDKTLESYEKSVAVYPKFGKLAEGYYQIGNIHLLNGDIEKSKAAFLALVTTSPLSTRASAAHFRIAELCFTDRDYVCALKHLEKINPEFVTDDIKEMAHFRKSEIYYNQGDFDEAVMLFGGYVEKVDRREFPKGELRGEALEYLAVSFSDMEEGADAAIKYFEKAGARPYEDTVIYAVGMKNYDHGQYEQSIAALTRAIQKFPLFVDAPKAQTNIINGYVIRRRHEEANKARETLVDTYSANSVWAQRNSTNAVALAVADEELRSALGSIAIYYHALAQASREPEKRLEFYRNALARYEQFVSVYPNDKWRVYEYSYNAAEAYMVLGQFEKAASNYDFVASANLGTYPTFKMELDTVGMEAQELEKMRTEKKASPVDISQSDAGFNAIVALDSLRQLEFEKDSLTVVQAYALPSTSKFITYIRNYQSRFPTSESAPEVLYLAASVHFDGENYTETAKECMSLLSAYGSDTSMYRRATKLMADAYTKDGSYDLAVANYDSLIIRTAKDVAEFAILTDLAAGAIYLKGESLRSKGQITAAANEFKRVSQKYPASTVADKGWFEAAVTYEAADSALMAAQVFKEFPVRFPQSDLVERSFVRSAENYVKAEQDAEAGAVMELAAKTVKNPEFAIGSLSKASEYYKNAQLLEKAAEMYYAVYQNYPTDALAPTALYNGGLAFEEAKNYKRAIELYTILGTKYVESQYASSGYFSIGLCYEKMGDFKAMAASFVDYAQKFTTNRDSQMKALMKAGDAYLDMGNLVEAQKNYTLAAEIFDRFHTKDAMAAEDGAKAHYQLGEIYRGKFEAIKLTGRNQKAVNAQLTKKIAELKPVLESYAAAITLGVAEWAIKSTYSIGLVYRNYTTDVREQTLFGQEDAKIGAQIKILSGDIQKGYDEAIDKFAHAVKMARENGIREDYVKTAELYLMETWYYKGFAFEECGDLLRNSQIPDGFTEEEEMAYIDALEEYYIQYVNQALPWYEGSIRHAIELGISKNEYTDKIQEHFGILMAYFGEQSEMAMIDLDEELARRKAAGAVVEVSDEEVLRIQLEKELATALSQITSVISSEMPIEQKISRLTNIEAEAKRRIMEEDILVTQYRNELGL